VWDWTVCCHRFREDTTDGVREWYSLGAPVRGTEVSQPLTCIGQSHHRLKSVLVHGME